MWNNVRYWYMSLPRFHVPRYLTKGSALSMHAIVRCNGPGSSHPYACCEFKSSLGDLPLRPSVGRSGCTLPVVAVFPPTIMHNSVNEIFFYKRVNKNVNQNICQACQMSEWVSPRVLTCCSKCPDIIFKYRFEIVQKVLNVTFSLLIIYLFGWRFTEQSRIFHLYDAGKFFLFRGNRAKLVENHRPNTGRWQSFHALYDRRGSQPELCLSSRRPHWFESHDSLPSASARNDLATEIMT